MINKEIRDYIVEINENAVFFDNPSFDESIIGVSTTGRVVYVYENMIEELAKTEDITLEEARDFISYDTERALSYYDSKYAPIIVEEGIIPLVKKEFK